MGYLIRKMEQEDIKQVQEVAKTTWNATYEGIIPLEVQEKFLNSAYNDDRMMQRLGRSTLYVAEIEGRVVGFANFSQVREDGKVELGAIYLYPEQQGNGIGSALLQKGIKDLEGVNKIYINVEKDNKIGKTFYEAKGFEVVKEFDDEFDGHILKTIRMVLKV
ncbi:GNAT family N-acetyltransferase [Cytobacillus oceanisediminis]|uniref:GNAT family acetyltransferase n=1 Tax=Cytobacillus oceanisediminis 2691 TaxID=1196031 RepID=A0A160ME85_9BACI|nr:GNAT family N-acetyltransferase [Cytobacillus oceanisediminis]AND41422.1 GNAT family acetyltransferase [Cytobacillus oceanisediminis 2691]